MAAPSAEEQLSLELLNRARAEPTGEYGRTILSEAPLQTIDPIVTGSLQYFGTNLATVRTELNALTPVAPVAWNSALNDAATVHSQRMINENSLGHATFVEWIGGGGAYQTILGSPANWGMVRENAALSFPTMESTHAAWFIDWGPGTSDGLQNPRGHRDAMMDAQASEIGIGVVAHAGGLSATQLFTSMSAGPQIVGVAINDGDGDRFYDLGEGLGGVTVSVSNAGGVVGTTTTWASGGYQLGVGAGTYTVTFSGGGLTGTYSEQVTVGAQNVKVDVRADQATGGTGSGNGTINGTAARDVLVGTSANEAIHGLDGDDDLYGAGGSDLLYGGSGNDLLHGGTGADGMIGDLGNDTYVVDNVGDLVMESAGAGHDVVLVEIDGYMLTDNVEQGVLGNVWGAWSLVGNQQSNLLSGNDFSNLISVNGGSNLAYGAGGDDTIIGGAVADLLSGQGDNDTLIGAGGSDILLGNQGNDRLVGGDGYDYLAGDFGDDTFVIGNVNFGEADLIVDFGAGTDRIELSSFNFGGGLGTSVDFHEFAVGPQATQSWHRLVYDTSTGALMFDGDGSGAGAAIHIATVQNFAGALGAEDFVIA